MSAPPRALPPTCPFAPLVDGHGAARGGKGGGSGSGSGWLGQPLMWHVDGEQAACMQNCRCSKGRSSAGRPASGLMHHMGITRGLSQSRYDAGHAFAQHHTTSHGYIVLGGGQNATACHCLLHEKFCIYLSIITLSFTFDNYIKP